MTDKNLTPQQQVFSEMLRKASIENIGIMRIPCCANCQQPIYYCDCPEFVEDKHE